MKSRKATLFFIALVLITVFAAGLHLTTRQQTPENTLLITKNTQEYTVDLDKLEYEQVTGIRVNGKGEEIVVDGLGISVSELLNSKKITNYVEIDVVSDDSYSAKLTKDEINAEEKAYFIIEDDELRLVVFGDTNSKRSVSNVKKIEVK